MKQNIPGGAFRSPTPPVWLKLNYMVSTLFRWESLSNVERKILRKILRDEYEKLQYEKE